MLSRWSRREMLVAGVAAVGVHATAGLGSASAEADKAGKGFRFCFNTSNIMGQRVPLVDEVELVAKAGYNAIEPWVREIDAYVKGGGKLADLRKRISDLGLTVENAIGFAAWIIDDEAERRKGLEQARREMEMVAQIGGKRIAAPPVGATNIANFNLLKAAERYRSLAQIGKEFGVTPQLEIWGHSKTLSKLGEAMMVAAESGFPGACVLPDVYHMYKANTPYEGLRLMSANALQVIHLNDYPADPPRATISDQYRVYPGDGIAPLDSILRDVAAVSPGCVLSLELFNRDYYKLDPAVVARTGLEKIKAAVARIARA